MPTFVLLRVAAIYTFISTVNVDFVQVVDGAYAQSFKERKELCGLTYCRFAAAVVCCPILRPFNTLKSIFDARSVCHR